MLTIRGIASCLVLSALVLALSPDEISRMSQCPPQEPAITFVAVGDVLLARGIERRITRYGRSWPFEKVTETLRSADLAFCNLECPLSAGGIKVNKPICFKADPANVQCLADAGFDVISLANNHGLDCGRLGLIETMHYLEKMGIAYAGAGNTLAESALPTIVDVRGVKIAFLAQNALYPEGVWFRPDAANIAPLDPETIEAEVADAARRADVVVVSLHWGVEYRRQPQPEQVEMARKLIDAGADLILGHHPHVTQPVERYHGGVIAYSLGNFLFDSPFAKCKESMILKCRLSKSGVSDLELIPVRIEYFRPGLPKYAGILYNSAG